MLGTASRNSASRSQGHSYRKRRATSNVAPWRQDSKRSGFCFSKSSRLLAKPRLSVSYKYAGPVGLTVVRPNLEGSRDGAVVRALASHQFRSGSIPSLFVKGGLILLLVLVLAPRVFFLRILRVSPLLKTNISNFEFDVESVPN